MQGIASGARHGATHGPKGLQSPRGLRCQGCPSLPATEHVQALHSTLAALCAAWFYSQARLSGILPEEAVRVRRGPGCGARWRGLTGSIGCRAEGPFGRAMGRGPPCLAVALLPHPAPRPVSPRRTVLSMGRMLWARPASSPRASMSPASWPSAAMCWAVSEVPALCAAGGASRPWSQPLRSALVAALWRCPACVHAGAAMAA